jgi:hypothetical protein
MNHTVVRYCHNHKKYFVFNGGNEIGFIDTKIAEGIKDLDILRDTEINKNKTIII